MSANLEWPGSRSNSHLPRARRLTIEMFHRFYSQLIIAEPFACFISFGLPLLFAQ